MPAEIHGGAGDEEVSVLTGNGAGSPIAGRLLRQAVSGEVRGQRHVRATRIYLLLSSGKIHQMVMFASLKKFRSGLVRKGFAAFPAVCAGGFD